MQLYQIEDNMEYYRLGKPVTKPKFLVSKQDATCTSLKNASWLSYRF